jgi:hypothetical protein
VFEEAGVPFSVLVDDAAGRCADGVCSLQEPVVTDGDPDDVGGVGECLIDEQSDIVYDPPAQNGFFQEGATVTAHVDCTVEGQEEPTPESTPELTEDPTEEDPTEEDPTEEDPAEGSPEGTTGEPTEDAGTPAELSPAAGTPGDGQ